MDESVSHATEHPDLKRGIGLYLLLFFVLGDIVGAGIYALVGEVGAIVGGAIWTAFLAAFVLAIYTAASYAELVTKYPRAGGSATYVNNAFKNSFVSFMVAFAVMASGITSACTLTLAFSGDYLSQFISVPIVAAALVFIVVVGLINFYGISESVKINVVLTSVEVFGLLLIILIGVLVLLAGEGDPGRHGAGVLCPYRLRRLGERRRGDPQPEPELSTRHFRGPVYSRNRLPARYLHRLDGRADG